MTEIDQYVTGSDGLDSIRKKYRGNFGISKIFCIFATVLFWAFESGKPIET